MKKFDFSLEKLLRFKQQGLDQQKGIMADLVSQKMGLEGKIETLKTEWILIQRELQQIIAGGTTIQKINEYKFQITNYAMQIEGYEKELSFLEAKIEIQREIVIGVSKEVSGMEKLKEKKWEEYEEKCNKAQERMIEEFVSGKQFFQGSLT